MLYHTSRVIHLTKLYRVQLMLHDTSRVTPTGVLTLGWWVATLSHHARGHVHPVRQYLWAEKNTGCADMRELHRGRTILTIQCCVDGRLVAIDPPAYYYLVWYDTTIV